jgi:hypothetical protein
VFLDLQERHRIAGAAAHEVYIVLSFTVKI